MPQCETFNERYLLCWSVKVSWPDVSLTCLSRNFSATGGRAILQCWFQGNVTAMPTPVHRHNANTYTSDTRSLMKNDPVEQGRRHGFLSGGTNVGRWPTYPQNTPQKTEMTPDLGHVILESGGDVPSKFFSLRGRVPPSPAFDAHAVEAEEGLGTGGQVMWSVNVWFRCSHVLIISRHAARPARYLSTMSWCELALSASQLSAAMTSLVNGVTWRHLALRGASVSTWFVRTAAPHPRPSPQNCSCSQLRTRADCRHRFNRMECWQKFSEIVLLKLCFSRYEERIWCFASDISVDTTARWPLSGMKNTLPIPRIDSR